MTDPAPSRIRPIEVVVIIAILLVLGSLLLPATVSVGQNYHQIRCESNLRALGFAMLSYHEAHKQFPPGVIAGGEASVPFGGPAPSYVARSKRCDNPGIRTSALTLILPFLDDRSPLDAYNQSLANCAVQNATAVATKVRHFVCPANDFVSTVSDYYEAPPKTSDHDLAITDYALSAGGTGLISDDYPHGSWPKYELAGWVPVLGQHRYAVGVFNVNWSASNERIRDGASKTFLMGESFSGAKAATKSDGRLARGNEPLGDGQSSIIVTTPWSQGFLGSEPRYDDGQIENYGCYGSPFAVTAWNAWYVSGGLADTARWFAIPPNEGGSGKARATYFRAVRPLFRNFKIADGSSISGDFGSVQGFRSKHATQPMLFADGSVRQIKTTIDVKIWVGLSSYRGWEEIPNDF